MRTLIWGMTALLAAGWTGLVWLTHRVTVWLLAAVEAGTLQDAGGALARLPLPQLPEALRPWIDTAWLVQLQAWAVRLLDGLGTALPSGDALMAWIGPLLWVGWGLGLLALLALAGLLHALVGRSSAVRQR